MTPDASSTTPAAAQPPAPKRGLARIAIWVAVALVAVVIVAVAVALTVTARPAFFNRYAGMQRSYAELQTSAHKNMRCNQCHVDSRGAFVGDAALVAEFYGSFFGKPREPRFVQMTQPTREACLACHRYDWSMDSRRTMKVPHPAHLRVASETRDCVTCHRWIGHEETYMVKHTQMPFSTVCASFPCHVGTKAATDCQNCHHVLQDTKGPWLALHPETVRAVGPNGCLESCHTADQCRMCHTTGKRPAFKTVDTQPGVKAIEQAHVLSSWISQHGTFALQDQSKCLICHVSEGECQDCHSRRPAFHGSTATWLGQHQPLAKANPQRCLTCHQQTWCDACHKQFKEMH